MGMVIAFAYECYEKGVISKADTGGIELRFGDADLMIRLLDMTAHREGFGDLLAEGVARLAKRWGVVDKDWYLATKGQELPMHDPRVKVGVGLSYATSTYGADHMYAAHDGLFSDEKFLPFKFIQPLGIYKPIHITDITPGKVLDKVRSFELLQTLWRTQDALGLCVFGYAPRGVMPLDKMVQCLNAITGWNASLFELMKAAERGSMIARAFNSREGFSIKDDTLPKRIFDPKPDGPNAGQIIFTEEDFYKAIRMLYEMMGVDPETGRPNRGKLLELGLDWVEEMLNK
jgi:aldehyde:ferredoxin oxidoreductase